MIILDTNVISELMRPEPSQMVVSWLDSQRKDELCLTALTQAELAFGIELMASGKRKTELTAAFKYFIDEVFADRVLAFDSHAADYYASIASARQISGRPISVIDAQIAALCLSAGAPLATRNTKDFAGTGVALINPWEDLG
ncbi:MAG: type II toxin-antitoxin system VapC family toxin [Coriobacteriales bacterium]|jgi:predicted nucleic acid-binding protein|nr:type II toxin-antitoxin system VapC family toxin [Coriobacteriales bacterium]